MKINEELILELIESSSENGYLKIIDHRNNIITLKKGVFSFNDFPQIKSKKAIQTIFLEALRLTRFVEFDNEKYVRSGSRWVKR